MSLNVLTTGTGSPVLLLHGFTGTARSWSRQIGPWSREHRVIAPDLLGHGGSQAPTDPADYALERQADALAELLELLEASPAAVVGYSMGARLALVLALSHPRAVDGLVLESPSAGILDPAARARRRATDDGLAEDIEREGLDAFVARWEASPLFDSHAALPDEVRAELRAERLCHDPRGLAGSLRGAGQGVMAPLQDRLVQIDAPTLVLAGGLDETGLARAREVAGGIPDARLEVVPGAGHTMHLEAPDAFLRLTSDHLSTRQATH